MLSKYSREEWTNLSKQKWCWYWWCIFVVSCEHWTHKWEHCKEDCEPCEPCVNLSIVIGIFDSNTNLVLFQVELDFSGSPGSSLGRNVCSREGWPGERTIKYAPAKTYRMPKSLVLSNKKKTLFLYLTHFSCLEALGSGLYYLK